VEPSDGLMRRGLEPVAERQEPDDGRNAASLLHQPGNRPALCFQSFTFTDQRCRFCTQLAQETAATQENSLTADRCLDTAARKRLRFVGLQHQEALVADGVHHGMRQWVLACLLKRRGNAQDILA
jgi:hypothetical protein